jgi:murein DD-endopeptidase MepM/ murein hydrolase activator NlpD
MKPCKRPTRCGIEFIICISSFSIFPRFVHFVDRQLLNEPPRAAPPGNMMGRRLAPAGSWAFGFVVGLLVVGALAGSGCGKKKNVVFAGDKTIAPHAQTGGDSFAAADFGKIDALIYQREIEPARALLEGMPASLRGTPAWHFRQAMIATAERDYIKGKEHILKARIGSAYPREFAYLAAYLELTDGYPIRAAEICLDIIDRDGRDRLAWMYLLHAAGDHPRHPGIRVAAGHLLDRYRRAPEAQALQAIMLFAGGETSAGVDAMAKLAKKRPDDFTIRRLHLDFLRNLGDTKKFAQAALKLLEELAPDHPERVQLQEEFDSLVLALRQRKSDPVPSGVAFNPDAASYEELLARVPANVPLSDRDPRDNMPKDYLDDKGEALYFLPYKANTIYAVGVRRDREPTHRFPKLEDPERDNRALHAIDFLLPAQTPVVAARGGVVSRMAVYQVNSGAAEFERVIEIAHRDGTIARYWHLQRMQAYVNLGDTVYRGQPLASVGETGQTQHQHLRFEVVEEVKTFDSWWDWITGADWDWWEPYSSYYTVPVRFADVAEPDGVPKEGRWYRSRNVFVPPVY